MADTLALGATAPASLPHGAPTRWETRQTVRTGTAADIKIYPQGARASGGALATVHVRCGREQQAETLARLIVAAPELRYVLRDLLPIAGSGLELTNADVAVARALLARLEGGAA